MLHRIAHSPAISASLYFIAIPLFGVIYALMPNDFFQANATAEVRARHLRGQIQRQLLPLVSSVYRASAADSTQLPVIDLSVSGLRSDELSLSFDTAFKRRNARSAVIYRPVWTLELPPLEEPASGLRLSARIERIPPYLSYALKHHHGDGADFVWGPLIGSISPDPDSSGVVPARRFGTIEGILTVPDTLYANLERYYVASQGNPDKLAGSLMRFMYLSSMTLTTLGFGDIVPVSDRARFAVACEAIYGVVMVGLFLNAVATRGLQRGRRDGGMAGR
jgi:hypothetical protein